MSLSKVILNSFTKKMFSLRDMIKMIKKVIFV